MGRQSVSSAHYSIWDVRGLGEKCSGCRSSSHTVLSQLEENRLGITDGEKACQPNFKQPFITWP